MRVTEGLESKIYSDSPETLRLELNKCYQGPKLELEDSSSKKDHKKYQQ